MVSCDLLHLPLFFFYKQTTSSELYTLSLHDALPICKTWETDATSHSVTFAYDKADRLTSRTDRLGREIAYVYDDAEDRKSTRLNSSHLVISYAVFCLKKKKIRLCETKWIR